MIGRPAQCIIRSRGQRALLHQCIPCLASLGTCARQPPLCTHKHTSLWTHTFTCARAEHKQVSAVVDTRSRLQARIHTRKNAHVCTPADPRRPVHLTVSAAPTCYLMLPPRGRLVPGHCCLVPNDHLPAIRQVRAQRAAAYVYKSLMCVDVRMGQLCACVSR